MFVYTCVNSKWREFKGEKYDDNVFFLVYLGTILLTICKSVLIYSKERAFTKF